MANYSKVINMFGPFIVILGVAVTAFELLSKKKKKRSAAPVAAPTPVPTPVVKSEPVVEPPPAE